MPISQTLSGGADLQLFEITNSAGATVRVTDAGASIVSLEVPGKDGLARNVVLGFDVADLGCYLTDNGPYLGCTVGRYCNRIGSQASFELDGTRYQLTRNNGDNCLHGGASGGLSRVRWNGEVTGEQSVAFRHTLEDGKDGFPGNLKVTVTYTLEEHCNDLRIEFAASTDKPTVCSLTNHSYFNLHGVATAGTAREEQPTIESHRFTIRSKSFVDVDDQGIPTAICPISEGDAEEFWAPRVLGEQMARVKAAHVTGAFDHCFVIEGEDSVERPCAVLSEDSSGISMLVYSSEPGTQLYTGNFLDGSAAGFKKHTGLCLETQHFPDSPNHPEFPSTRLDPGQEYRSRTRFSFKR